LDYHYYDIQKIAIQHINLEAKLTCPKLLDTDLLTLKIWSQEKYGLVSKLITNELELFDKNRFYFLCKPDIPWEQDPMREHPQDRDRLFEEHTELLQKMNLDFMVVSGSLESRIFQISNTLDNLLVGNDVLLSNHENL
jgi:nicotinamide riboside kinase